MQESFETAFSVLLRVEGGVSNDPNDIGKLTNLGVTQAEFTADRKARGLSDLSVKLITRDEAEDLYRRNYWDALRLDEYPAGVDLCTFDCAVNNGVSGAAKIAQQSANKLGTKLTVDGHLGALSLAAIKALDPCEYIDAFCDQRLATDRGFKVWRYFGKGWTSRVNGTIRPTAKALALSNSPQLVSQPDKGKPMATTTTTVLSNPADAVIAAAQGALVDLKALAGSVAGALGSGMIATGAGLATTLMPTLSGEIAVGLVAFGGVLSAVVHGLIAMHLTSIANNATLLSVEKALNTTVTALGEPAISFENLAAAIPPATA